MDKYRDCKIWVGSDPYLMKAVIKALEADGCEEHTAYNIGKPIIPLAVYVSSTGDWYYSKAREDSRTAFNTSVRKEMSVRTILPVLEKIPEFSAIWVRNDSALNEKVQRALFKLGYSWYGNSKEPSYINAHTLVLANKDLSYNMAERDSEHNQKWSEIWPWQIPGFEEAPTLAKEELIDKRIPTDGDNVVSERIQRALFALGFQWGDHEPHKIHFGSTYLFPSSHHQIMQGFGPASNYLKYFEVQPEQIPGYTQLTFSSPTNTMQHDTKGKTLSDPRATVGSGLRAQIGTGKVSSSQRLVGKSLSAKPGRGRIGRSLLGHTVLSAADY